MDPRSLPEGVARLFWDVDPTTVDLGQHSDYVIERVMIRGDWVAMKWLRATYPRDVLAEFLRRKSSRLPPRERVYWGLIAGVAVDAGRGRSRPAWAGE